MSGIPSGRGAAHLFHDLKKTGRIIDPAGFSFSLNCQTLWA